MTAALRVRAEAPSLGRGAYQRLVAELRDVSGIQLNDAKIDMIRGRLTRRMNELGLHDIEEYAAFVLAPENRGAEFPYVLDMVTTNTTSFFREAHHFDTLRQELVPTLIANRRAHPRLKVWSAAASRGAEAYSIMMVLEELKEERRDFDYCVLGTDISHRVLEEARDAIYANNVLQPAVSRGYGRFLNQGRGQYAGNSRIAAVLRQKVNFFHLNLMEDFDHLDSDIDLIFLRNVLIYFDAATQTDLIRRLGAQLRPGGYLIIGSSEAMSRDLDEFEQIAPSTFIKRE